MKNLLIGILLIIFLFAIIHATSTIIKEIVKCECEPIILMREITIREPEIKKCVEVIEVEEPEKAPGKRWQY